MSNFDNLFSLADPDAGKPLVNLSWIPPQADQDVYAGNSSESGSPKQPNPSGSWPVREESPTNSGSSGETLAQPRPWADSPLSLSFNEDGGAGLTGETYYLHAPLSAQPANQEAIFFMQLLSPLEGELAPPATFKSFVTHSSGYVYPAKIERDYSLPGYRGTFFPIIPGMYSVSLCQTGPGRDNIHGMPLTIPISRNYTFEARTPVVETLPVGASGAKFWGIATDKYMDTLYVTDRDMHEIIAVHPTGQPLFRCGKNAFPGGNNLYRPTGIVCDAVNRRLIVCDKDNHRLVFVSLDGRFISAFGKKGHQNGEFNYPWDVDVSPSGDLIAVTDSRNHRIQLFDRFGIYLRKFSVFETQPFEYKQEFDYPRGITFDKEGKYLYVTDFNTHNVLRLNLSLTESKKLIPPGKLCRPQGITVDDIGNLLICDSRQNLIRVVAPQGGDLLTTISQVGNSVFTVPCDVTVMRDGEAALLDTFGRVRIF